MACGEGDSALFSHSPIRSDSTLGAIPWEGLVVAPITSPQPSLDSTRLGIPDLPVRAVPIHKSSITHTIYTLNAADLTRFDSRGCAGKMANTLIFLHPNSEILLHLKICLLRAYLPKLASDSLITSIMALAIQRSLPL
jgi:hypothetical protein